MSRRTGSGGRGHGAAASIPWGTYRTYEEAYRVGRELERLNFYWYEHPMPEYRVAAYVKLCRELSYPDPLARDRGWQYLHPRRLDQARRVGYEPHRRVARRHHRRKKMAAVCEAYGVKCEIHMSGFANLQVLGSTSEDVCEYYERGLLAPGVDYETPPPYLEAIGDPMDAEGYVHLPQEPGMGYRIVWDYIEQHRNAGSALSA